MCVWVSRFPLSFSQLLDFSSPSMLIVMKSCQQRQTPTIMQDCRYTQDWMRTFTEIGLYTIDIIQVEYIVFVFQLLRPLHECNHCVTPVGSIT